MPKPPQTRPGRNERPRGHGTLPTATELVAFLRGNPETAGRREIARAFRLAPADEPGLRDLLTRMQSTGEIVRAANRKLVAGPALPEVTVIEGVGHDADGVPLARPAVWSGTGSAPVFRLNEDAAIRDLPAGARAAARLIRRDSGEVEGHLLRRLDRSENRIVGVYQRQREGGILLPADRRDRSEYRVSARDDSGARHGELVIAEERTTRRAGSPQARIVERLGPADAAGAVSLIAIASHDIPTEFPSAALAEAAQAKPVDPAGRADLRALPLVTIDGSDARDFDDAVWAEPDDDPENAGGWHLVVAIADVAWYVRPASALDKEAERRGNSVYFPDRVVPMLPEALSNELCSLQPGVDRACVAAHLWIDSGGRKRRHRFERAIMHSAARLTYEQVQAAHDSGADLAFPGSADRIAGLYGAFAALDRARAARGTLELDLVELRVVLDETGAPVAIRPRPRLDSHRLIEEFMILANVAAAEELETRRRPCMYRVHDVPDPEKVGALRDLLDELGIPGLALAKGQALRPELFNRVLRRAAETPQAPLVNELVLRAQAQAAYSSNNIGHFGLALRRYAHFTSPIRRYADLLVHRALADAAPPAHVSRLAEIGEHLSATERRAAAAERAAIERYRAMLMAGSVGEIFAARITGVARFGLFVTAAESGADGLVPIRSLPSDYYEHDPARHSLTGRYSGRAYTLGDPVSARLTEADPISGRMVFRIEEEPGDNRRVSTRTRQRRFPTRRPGEAARMGRRQRGGPER